MLRALIIAVVAFVGVFASQVLAAEDAEHPEEHKFGFEGPFGVYDMAAVQRGYQVYAEVCSTCHGMDHLSYRNLGEKGGPFAAYWVVDEATGERVIHPEPGPPPHGHGAKLTDINDNPYVRAIAEGVAYRDINPETGGFTRLVIDAATKEEVEERYTRPGRVSDHFLNPYENEIQARNNNNGALPPDLSVIVLARHGGAEYVRSLLMGYVDPAPKGVEVVEGKYYNKYFPGHWIGMTPPLTEGRVTYQDGTKASIEQMSSDVAHFLQWAADPHMVERKTVGFRVLAFLLVLSALLYIAYRQVWRGVKH